ncbi:MAG TPA: Tim44/TimA family putative adaptor protein [Candidatus Sulfotelmatobacter sp.]|nr:Tim44/TimA family putative adaptor protein [Candidatus Sulfotelmatobacter sp.]
MSDGNYVLEIILLAMVAGFIILRLRSVLGRRTGNEPPRPAPPVRPGPEEDKIVALPDRSRRPDVAEPAAPSGPAGAGLRQIKLADPKFDVNDFISGAKAAYEMIVTAFAAGDLATLKPLLNQEVFDNFRRAIEQRKAAGQRLETRLVGIKRVDLLEAELKGRTAEVTVKFVSELINATYDTDNKVVAGNAGAVDEVTDIWSFARDIRSSDPNWFLAATSTPS